MVSYRKDALATGTIHHVFVRSIAEYRVFTRAEEYNRLREEVQYYNREKSECNYALYKKVSSSESNLKKAGGSETSQRLVDVIAYCVMPTHAHFVFCQRVDDGISVLMRNVLNSYTRYFNLRHKRKGPLWDSRFQNVLVKTDEQLVHLTRYIHLNPVTGYFVRSAEEWPASSYGEYMGEKGLCNFEQYVVIDKEDYAQFVEDRIGYQQELARIKSLLLD